MVSLFVLEVEAPAGAEMPLVIYHGVLADNACWQRSASHRVDANPGPPYPASMAPRNAPVRSLLLALVILGPVSLACGSVSTAGGTTTTDERAMVITRLESRLADDPNRELCERLATDLATGDGDTVRALFDHASFVERIIAKGGVPADVEQTLRANPSQPANFGRMVFPEGSQFLCLGTRTAAGEPHIAIRQWTPTRFDYWLLHLSGNESVPIDDTLVVSNGSASSAVNALSMAPATRAHMTTISSFFQLSFDRRYAEIIDGYRALPANIRQTPNAFMHFINAVYTLESTGSPLYEEASRSALTVLADHPYALAYWQLMDARRRGDRSDVDTNRRVLLDLLDDYELLGGR